MAKRVFTIAYQQPNQAMPKSRIIHDPQFPNRLIIEHDGFSGSVAQWAAKLKISKVTLHGRLRTMPLKKALTPGKLNLAQHTPENRVKRTSAGAHLPKMPAPNPKDEGKWFLIDDRPAFRYKGSVKTIYQWSKKLDIDSRTLKARLLEKRQRIQTAVAKTINHGTVTAYVVHGCRCDLCRANNTRRHRELQQRKRLKDMVE